MELVFLDPTFACVELMPWDRRELSVNRLLGDFENRTVKISIELDSVYILFL